MWTTKFHRINCSTRMTDTLWNNVRYGFRTRAPLLHVLRPLPFRPYCSPLACKHIFLSSAAVWMIRGACSKCGSRVTSQMSKQMVRDRLAPPGPGFLSVTCAAWTEQLQYTEVHDCEGAEMNVARRDNLRVLTPFSLAP